MATLTVAHHANPLVDYVLFLDFKVTLPKYNINNRFLVLEVCAVGKQTLYDPPGTPCESF
jgi:hypothetical protein